MPDGQAPSLLLDAAGIIRMASASLSEMMGLAPRALEGRPIQALLESPAPRVIETLLAELQAEARLAVRLRLADGSLAEADLWLSPLPAADGQGRSYLGTIELMASRAAREPAGAVALRTGAEAVSDAVVICRDGSILEATEGMGELAGVDAARARGWSLKSFVVAEDLLPVVEILRRVQRGDPARAEFGFHLMRSGREPIEVSARARSARHGGLPAVLLGLTDISDAVRGARLAADRLLHLDAALAASNDAVLIVGLPREGSRVILASPALRELFGVEPARFLGRPFWDLWSEIRPAHTFPDDDERVLRGLLEEQDAVRVDTLLLSRPRRRVVERFFGPMRGPGGSVLGRVCTFRDVTQRAEAEAEMRRGAEEARRARDEIEKMHEEMRLANEGLERRMGEMQRLNRDLRSLDEMKSNLLANVSHELQTPLVSIKGYTELILKGRLGGVTPEQEKGLQVALRNINRLIALIENLLSFARSEGPLSELKLESFPLRPLVEEVFDLLHQRAAGQGVTLRLAVPADVHIRADRDKILQVVLNLVSNAVKYNRAGGDVFVECERVRGAALRVNVRDTGVGISHEDLERIFERFYRGTGAATAEEGSGIGLSIARNLLRLHGCTIRADSEEGRGSVFSFTLPVERARVRTPARGLPRGGASHEPSDPVEEPSRGEP